MHWNLVCLRLEVRAADTFPNQSAGWAILSVRTQMRPGRAPSLPLPVFHRPVTSRLFHLWKQLLSLPSLRFPPDPIPSERDGLHSGARGASLRSPAAHLSRGGGSLGEVGGGFPREGWRGRWGVVRGAVDG